MLLDKSWEPIKHPISDLYPDVPVHHWSELQGNKFKFKLDIKMLVFSDYTLRVKANIIGRPKGSHYASWMNVIFDEEYVKQKLARETIRPLSNLTKDKFLEIMGEVYDSAKGK